MHMLVRLVAMVSSRAHNIVVKGWGECLMLNIPCHKPTALIKNQYTNVKLRINSYSMNK